ncbi:efflux RND transporter periplasmic adaptor subunit [Sphingobacterium sp. LRF_L2]|uniref:efflux RND transporter periplasmic adaptor subunit n=1 Tax=Sphingobacterium sp. LRF_L2 TaxID=3369421 RepID=UPI003F62E67F
MNTKNIFPLIGLTSIFAITISACSQQPAQSTTSEEQQHEVLQIEPQVVHIYTDYPATLQGEEVVEIRPRVEGYLEELYIDEGARVQKGQRLFRISSPQYEQELRSAQASIQTAQADVDAAEMTVRKTRPLVEKEIISAYELESAQYTLKAKKAALAQANATLANAQANLGYTIITSPADGIVGTIPYKKGSLVSSTSTSPLTTLSANKDMYVYFSLNEKQLLDFNRRFTGNTIQEKLKNLPAVQLILADGSMYEKTGIIQTASGLITTETGSSNFRAIFPNEGALLQSGGSATIRIPRQLDSALVVPQSATYELQDKRMIYTVGNDNRVLSRSITATSTNDGQYFIVESGLTKGEKVVLNGITGLKDSVLIVPHSVDPKNLTDSTGK